MALRYRRCMFLRVMSSMLMVTQAALGACVFDDALPVDARITCTSSGDCPDGMTCAGLLARCVPDDGDLDGPDAVATLSSTLLPRDGSVDVTLTPDEELGAAPTVFADDIERTSAPSVDGASFVTTFSAAELGDGASALSAVLVDASGNPGIVPLGIVTVDATDPGVDEETPIGLTIVPPPGSLVANPTRVVVGSRVIVSFDADEPLREPPVVTARGPADVPFAPLGEEDGAFVYAFDVNAPLADGAYQVEVALVDLAGNAAVVVLSLPDPGIVADDVVPSPCVARTADGVEVCTDFDGDGVDGLSNACPNPSPLDCDDTDPLTHPGALEIAGDLRDNDCAGDGDTPLDEDTAVFADPNAAAGGDGSRDAPFDDLYVANDVAKKAGKALALRAGDFGIYPAGWFTGGDVIGGLDEAWAVDTSARTRVEFIDGRDTVFPSERAQVWVGMHIVSANSAFDTRTPLTLLRVRIDAFERAGDLGALVMVDSDVVNGFLSAIELHAYGSRFAGEVTATNGLLLRTRHTSQIGAASGGKLEVVSSSVAVVDKDRASKADGVLALYASNLRSLSSSAIDDVSPAIDLGAGEAHVFGSVVESRNAIVSDPGQGGTVFLNASAVASACGIFGIGCNVASDGVGCIDHAVCGSWDDAVVVALVTAEESDEHVLTNPELAGAGPALLEVGAPTSVAGDLVGRCRDTSAPSLGATTRD
jgi:hypothetical protein